MENFVFDIKTKAYFGKDQIENLGNILNQYGKKILLVYGGGSIKKNGIYDKILSIVKENNIELFELSGVEPNPTVKTARKGVEIAKREQVDCILGVGGGSAIDCAKAIGVAAKYDCDIWDFFSYKILAQKSLPVVGIITLAATGTEMSPYSVLTNEETTEKNGIFGEVVRLNETIIDPAYTFSVNAYHTAAGVADIMSHVMEGYFSNNNEYLQNRMCEAVLKTCLEFGPKALKNPNDYEARAQISWASSVALNKILSYGLNPYSSACHLMGQTLSAKYDITHGVSLALIHPKWFEFCIKKGQIKRFVEFGKNVWGLSGNDEYVATQSVKELSKFFFDVLKIPANLRETNCGADKKDFKELAEYTSRFWKSENWYVPTTAKDIEEIYNSIY